MNGLAASPRRGRPPPQPGGRSGGRTGQPVVTWPLGGSELASWNLQEPATAFWDLPQTPGTYSRLMEPTTDSWDLLQTPGTYRTLLYLTGASWNLSQTPAGSAMLKFKTINLPHSFADTLLIFTSGNKVTEPGLYVEIHYIYIYITFPLQTNKCM